MLLYSTYFSLISFSLIVVSPNSSLMLVRRKNTVTVTIAPAVTTVEFSSSITKSENIFLRFLRNQKISHLHSHLCLDWFLIYLVGTKYHILHGATIYLSFTTQWWVKPLGKTGYYIVFRYTRLRLLKPQQFCYGWCDVHLSQG